MSSELRRMPRAVAGNGSGVVDDKAIRRCHHQPGNGGEPVGGVDSGGVTERKIRLVLGQSQLEFYVGFICI
jgi:hypothetical protein